MLNYRLHVYSLAMSATAEAAKFSLLLSQGLANSDSDDTFDHTLSELKSNAASLRAAVDKFLEALPLEVKEKAKNSKLKQHLYFIDYYLGKRLLQGCVGNSIDIAKHDLPQVVSLFEEWYEGQSPTDNDLASRLKPLVARGQSTTALREAWPIFKTRMVEKFGLPENTDGQELANALFGSSGATAGLLENAEREGYLSLFKGLYQLYRNPVVHNDLPTNPEEASAVLELINSTLVRIEGFQGPGASDNAHLPTEAVDTQ